MALGDKVTPSLKDGKERWAYAVGQYGMEAREGGGAVSPSPPVLEGLPQGAESSPSSDASRHAKYTAIRGVDGPTCAHGLPMTWACWACASERDQGPQAAPAEGRGAWAVVADFERALERYTGAPHVVTVDSCTNALGLCLRWRARSLAVYRLRVTLPRRTYVGVAQQARHAGFTLGWRDEDWQGDYELHPWQVWDAAKRFTGGMWRGYRDGSLVCVSFHVGKILGLGRGGAILTDDPKAADWFRRMRHDGRTPGLSTEQDTITEPGFHCALTPPEAALGLWRLEWLPRENADLPNTHTDISRHPVFRR